jgi:hypothetical protein
MTWKGYVMTLMTTHRRRFGKNGQPIGISFNDLQSREQAYLRCSAPDMTGLVNGSRQATIENFKERFIEMFPNLAEEIPDTKTMQRLMQAGVKQRQKTARLKKVAARKPHANYLPPSHI